MPLKLCKPKRFPFSEGQFFWISPSCSEKDRDHSDARQLPAEKIRHLNRWSRRSRGDRRDVYGPSGARWQGPVQTGSCDRLQSPDVTVGEPSCHWVNGVASLRWSSLIGAVSGRVVRSKVTNCGGLRSCPTFSLWNRLLSVMQLGLQREKKKKKILLIKYTTTTTNNNKNNQ